MKNKKSLVAIFVLFLVIGVCVSTYAIYKSSATGTATVTAAAWEVKVNTADIVTTNTYTFAATDINWTSTGNGQAGTIAPGATGTITILIDATGTQVPVDYNVQIGTKTASVVDPDFTTAGFTVTKASTSPDLTGTIAYSTETNAMKKTITLDVVWTGTDSTDKNAADVTLEGATISIPVTVTATQHTGA